MHFKYHFESKSNTAHARPPVCVCVSLPHKPQPRLFCPRAHFLAHGENKHWRERAAEIASISHDDTGRTQSFKTVFIDGATAMLTYATDVRTGAQRSMLNPNTRDARGIVIITSSANALTTVKCLQSTEEIVDSAAASGGGGGGGGAAMGPAVIEVAAVGAYHITEKTISPVLWGTSLTVIANGGIATTGASASRLCRH